MARTSNLHDYLTDVANAIKEKKGDTTPINASEFDTEIINLPSGGGEKKYTGSYDVEGLKTIGYTDEEIEYYNKNGVAWDKELNDNYKLNATELAGDGSSTTRFMPINSTRIGFASCPNLLTIPNRKFNNLSSLFQSDYSLITIPELDTSRLEYFEAKNMCNNCYSLIKFPQIDTSKIQSMTYMFNYCYSLTTIPMLDLSSCTDTSNMFSSCYSLIKIPPLNTSKVNTMRNMFSYNYSLKEVLLLDLGKCTDVANMFQNCNTLTHLGGFKDLGKAYSTAASANYSNYKLNLSASKTLTEQSMINVLNNLYDIASDGIPTQTVQFGSTNLAKLTSEEGQQALANARLKGWTIS